MRFFLDWIERQLESRRHYKREIKQCESCLVLQDQIAAERNRNEQLIQHIIALTTLKEAITPVVNQEELKPVPKSAIPWRVRQRMLEDEDRQKFKLMQDKENELNDRNNELEKELEKIAAANDAAVQGANKNAG